MDPKEQKQISDLMGKVIDQKVTPRLEKLEKGQEKLETQNESIIEQVVQNSEDIETIKIDITEMQEDVSDNNLTTERIETKLNTVINNQDNMDLKTRQLNRRVLKLEAKKA